MVFAFCARYSNMWHRQMRAVRCGSRQSVDEKPAKSCKNTVDRESVFEIKALQTGTGKNEGKNVAGRSELKWARMAGLCEWRAKTLLWLCWHLAPKQNLNYAIMKLPKPKLIPALTPVYRVRCVKRAERDSVRKCLSCACEQAACPQTRNQYAKYATSMWSALKADAITSIEQIAFVVLHRNYQLKCIHGICLVLSTESGNFA